MVLSLDIRSHSEIGLVRKNNQDSGYVSPTMLVVADGMGGAAAGDLASTVAVRQVARADSHRTGEEMLEVLAGAVSAANDELADLVTWDHSLEGMGTTFCGVMFDGTQLGLVHIGDSRGYMYRDHALERMTHDHSWVQSLVDEGRITESEAAVHPHRSLLLKVLNGQPQHTPDTRLVDVHEGDRLLFCSDGLCGFVPDHVISEILGQESLDDAMALLITEAHAAGGSDNITIVLADVVAQDDALDAVEPKIIGAAAFTAVPEHEVTAPIPVVPDAAPGEARGSARRTGETPLLFDSEAEESIRYAPIDPEHGHARRTWLLSILGVLVVAAVAFFGVHTYLGDQYYVGDDNGTVAIYQGIPDRLVWVQLSKVTETTDISTSDLPNYYRTKVESTISVDSVDSARATVAELRSGAQRCKALKASPKPSSSASPKPSSSARPSTPTASATTSPTAGSPSASGSSLPKVSEDDCS
ncbi:PP2C family protein-serine/threonine phosphatase [Acidipropionibacterium acidipropionici]|uniref:PP2C family protein-serine/threonine phosphatase n=1 Tax=Acidipropionibacterium acidipropionici TaxID=1748 RepID=UPI00110A4A0C|nr:protein phosphatase 2C domain-containing protein [Acidipropionibacterium acidipropionici]QCV96000.1 serine/threonine-protein phosphatase [Acidipropionibacterium acidipropionici]